VPARDKTKPLHQPKPKIRRIRHSFLDEHLSHASDVLRDNQVLTDEDEVIAVLLAAEIDRQLVRAQVVDAPIGEGRANHRHVEKPQPATKLQRPVHVVRAEKGLE